VEAEAGGARGGRRRPARFAPSKFAIPDGGRALVERSALLRRLDDADPAALRLVVGSPGSGKTSLLAQWARTMPAAEVAWVSADGADRDPVRFWQAVVTALRGVHPELGEEAFDLLTLDGRVEQDALEALLIDAAVVAQPLTLVIDDLHLAAPAVVDHLATLVARGWAVRVAIGSRSDVAARFGRLHLEGRAVEVREGDLRFDAEEAAALVEAIIGPSPLTAEELEALTTKTEGWAAGLQLGALALVGQDDRAEFVRRMAGTDQVVSQYLSAELIDAQPPEVRRFLLDTCIVDELSPSLASALAPESSISITEVEARHLLLTRLAADGSSFRYHHLFAELLRYRLRAEDPAHEVAQHRRAAHWYLRAGDPSAGFRHLWAAGDRTEAMALVHGSVIDAYLAGHQHVVHQATGLLTDAELRASPDHAVSLAMALLLEGRPEPAMLLARRITGLGGGVLAPSPAIRLGAVQTMAQLARCDPDASLVHAADVLALAEEHAIDDEWVAIACAGAVRAHLWTGSVADAARYAERIGEVGPSLLDAVDHRSTTAHLRLAQGRLHEAVALAEAAVEAVAAAEEASPDVAVLPRTVLGLALLELGEAERAAPQLQAAVDGGSAIRRPAMVAALLALSRIFQSEGRLEAAASVLDRATPLLRMAPDSSPVRAQVVARQAAVHLVAGDVDRASEVARSLPEGWHRTQLEVAADLAAGRVDAADRRALAASEQDLEGPDALALALLHLRIALARHRPEAVAVAAEAVLDRSAAGGFAFAIAEAGADVLAAVVDVARRRPQTDHLRRLQLTRPHIVAADRPRPELAIDALSEREQTVLRYLVTAMSYREIADELYVSVNTVKTHVKNVIRKLHAESRADAIRRARELGYL
jgi:LuxR family maltose regulon positive regulatory protein